MRDRLYLALVQLQGGLNQSFAVAGGAGVDNMGAVGKLFPYILDSLNCGSQRAAVVIAVEGIEQGSVLAYNGHLGGGGAGVNA